MAYPQTGKEVFVSFSMSNTMLTGIGKGTITREDVSADYLKDLFGKYGVIVSAKRIMLSLLAALLRVSLTEEIYAVSSAVSSLLQRRSSKARRNAMRSSHACWPRLRSSMARAL